MIVVAFFLIPVDLFGIALMSVIVLTVWRVPTLKSGLSRGLGFRRTVFRVMGLWIKDLLTMVFLFPVILIGILRIPTFFSGARELTRLFWKHRDTKFETNDEVAEMERRLFELQEKKDINENGNQNGNANENENEKKGIKTLLFFFDSLHNFRLEDGFGSWNKDVKADDYGKLHQKPRRQPSVSSVQMPSAPRLERELSDGLLAQEDKSQLQPGSTEACVLASCEPGEPGEPGAEYVPPGQPGQEIKLEDIDFSPDRPEEVEREEEQKEDDEAQAVATKVDLAAYFSKKKEKYRNKEMPLSLTLFRPLFWREAKLSILNFHHIIFFPVRMFALLFSPVFWYVRWRNEHNSPPEPGQPVRSSHLSTSFFFRAVAWLYSRCPRPSVASWHEFALLERFLVVTLLLLPVLLLNELAVVLMTPVALFMMLQTCGQSSAVGHQGEQQGRPKLSCCDRLVILVQGILLLPTVGLLMALVGFPTLSYYLTSYFTSGSVLTPSPVPVSVYVVQSVVILAGAAACELVVRSARYKMLAYRPQRMYVYIALVAWDTVRGKGLLWDFYLGFLARVVQCCYDVKKKCGCIGSLFAELVLTAMLVAWGGWVCVPPILLQQYIWLCLTVPITLGLWYRAKKVIKDNWRRPAKRPAALRKAELERQRPHVPRTVLEGDFV